MSGLDSKEAAEAGEHVYVSNNCTKRSYLRVDALPLHSLMIFRRAAFQNAVNIFFNLRRDLPLCRFECINLPFVSYFERHEL